MPDDCRLVLFENKFKVISILGWTKENDLVILETASLNKTNVLKTESIISATENAQVSINTVYGALTVCESKFELYRWDSKYSCSDKIYSTDDKRSQIIISSDSEHLLMSPMTEYKRNSGDEKIRRLVDLQEQAIANRSKLVDAYMAQLEILVEATNKGSNLFNVFFNRIVKLLPTNWAKFIKTFLLAAGIVVAVPIVFLMLLITCKCLSLPWWCYAPVLSRIAGVARGTRSVASGVGCAVGSLCRRIRPGAQSRSNVINRNENIKQEHGTASPSASLADREGRVKYSLIKYDFKQTFAVYMNFHVCIMYVSCINTYRYIHEAIFQYMQNT